MSSKTFACILTIGVALSTGAQADSDTPSLDPAVSPDAFTMQPEKISERQPVNVTQTPGRSAVGVEVSLDGAGKGDEKFLYLKGDFHVGETTQAGSGLISRSLRDAGLSNPETPFGVFTPRFANIRLGFLSESGSLLNDRPGLDVALTASLAGGETLGLPMWLDVVPTAEDRAVNLGVSVGYAGFSLGASYLQESRAFDGAYHGYDLDLSYEADKWGTSLGFRGLGPAAGGPELDLIGTQNLYAVRLGAFYRLWPGFTLGGRFQFYDYSLIDSNEGQNRGEFLLNTNLNF